MTRSPARVSHGGLARVVAPSASWTGRIANLSVGGAFITGGPALEVGRRITISIDLGDGRPEIEAHARIAWCRATPQDDQPVGVGIKFVRLDAESLRRIANVVDLYTLAPREIQ